MSLGLELGKHIAVDAVIKTKECPEGEEVSRKYTPTSWIFDEGKFELLIKVYYKDTDSRFPDGGLMSQYLANLPIGSSIKIRGPLGKFTYYGDGLVNILGKEKTYKHIGMIAGGTGITPIYQLLQAADKTKDGIDFSLISANKTIKDILLLEEIDAFYRRQNFNFKFYLSVDKEWPEDWKGGRGFMVQEMLEANLPKASDETLIVTCGPPIMCEHVRKLLMNLGHQKENIFDF